MKKRFSFFIMLVCLLMPFALTGCKNSNKNTLSTPTIFEIKGGTIVFNTIEDAEYYTISINDYNITLDANYSQHVQIIDNKINYDASKIFVIGDSYTVRVQANSSKKNDSSFSGSYSYKHSGTILKPNNVKINSTTLTWDVVENASYYLVKIITPNDTVIFDKNGNALTKDDSASISIADLTEYSFNTNHFDFASLLTKAGTYKFYVCAVLSDGTSYTESGYTYKVDYIHNVTLSSPTNGKVYKVDNELHLVTAIDQNANAISIKCDEFEKTAEINAAEQSITLLNENFLNINLTKYFQSFISSGKLNFETIKQFTFATQCKYIAANPDASYYIDSNYSKDIIFENTLTLSAPTLSVDFSVANNCYVASWQSEQKDLIGEYKLLVATSNELKEYKLDSNIDNMLILDDYVAVAVQAIGVGNYLSSPLSEFVANPNLNRDLPEVSYSIDGNILSWTDLHADYYIIEFANKTFSTTNTSFELTNDMLASNNESIKIVSIVESFKPLTTVVGIDYSLQLATPTFGYSQGFNSSKLYELTFTGVDNALGYYVYVKSKDATEFSRINTLYTSTAIDLSQYISTEGEYTDYEVKVQAVADLHSIYTNSELSSSVSVSHIKVLESPEFYKTNGVATPISKQITNGTLKYILKFYGVDNAGSYEILINYNKLTVNAKGANYTGLYEVDLSNYLISANNYEIKVRAVPSDSTYNMQASEYSVANYVLTKQLPSVENILVTENEGVYTLSFDPIDNAESYRIRIVKENDSSYLDYLNSLGLSNSLTVKQSTDISNYVKQQGVYYFYVTALATKQNSYYADSNESSTYATLSKLTSLERPSNIIFVNASKDSYLLNWTGDENADYYLVKLTDPNGISYEFKVYSSTSANISRYMTIQGTYDVSIYSMVNGSGANSALFSSSSASSVSERYVYQTEQDFLRHSIYMYGENFNFVVKDVNDLKNLLWYHYLYEIDDLTGLSLMVEPQEKEDSTMETLKEAILRLATEANDSLLYNFNNDEQWLALKAEPTTTDNELFSYICQKLLVVYPEFNTLESFTLNHTANSQIFTLTYHNGISLEKQDISSTTFTNTNYGNNYSYIDLYSRRSATGVFKIDAREEMLVTTTEQLLQAVQHNRKPKFIGESSTAESVYSNAKLVLSAIVTNNMSDVEKVTAIFDWLEYGFDLTYHVVNGRYYISGSLENENISTFGGYKQYYLEGIFENITMLANGDIVIGNKLATSWSYSKAFALMCAIEGIDAVIVNGNYTYTDPATSSDVTVDHVWNKVLIDTTVEQTGKKWYSLDLTFSDNRVYFADFSRGYGISSHTYFLTSDSFIELNLNVTDSSFIISSDYETTRECKTSYNYYANSSFAMTYRQIDTTILDFENAITSCSGFEYAKEFNTSGNYQLYAKTTGYGPMQAFLLNTMIYAEYQADHNASNKSVFEFRFNWIDNGGSNIFNLSQLRAIFDSSPNQYSLKLKLLNDANGTIYSVEDSENKTTTIVYIVEKTA